MSLQHLSKQELINLVETLHDAAVEASGLFDNYPECYESIGTLQVLNNAITASFDARKDNK